MNRSSRVTFNRSRLRAGHSVAYACLTLRQSTPSTFKPNFKARGLKAASVNGIIHGSPSGDAQRRSTNRGNHTKPFCCLLYTSDAADERSSVDLGGRRIIK